MAYVKKDWKDLPDQTTPITADDLDRMENGIYDNDIKLNIGTEVDDDYRVNVVANSNLFDKDNANTFQGYFYSTETTISSSAVSKCLYIPITGGNTYTIKKVSSQRFNAGTTSTTPQSGVSLIDNANNILSGQTPINPSQITIKTSASANYLVVWYYASNADTLTETQILNSIRIVEGDGISKIYIDEEQLFPKYNGVMYANDFKCKNLLPFNGKSFSIGSLNIYCNNGNLYFNGSLSGEIYKTNSNWKNYFNFTLPAGTYTLSTTLTLSANVHIYILKYSDDSNINVDGGTFTITEETKVYLGFYLYNQSYSNTQIICQLEKGEATPYTPHKNFENEEVYSASEIRIGTWVDGKPLYQKSFIKNVNVTGTDTNIINLSTETPNYEHLWIDESHSFMEISNQSLPLNWYSSASDYIRTSVSYQNNAVRTKGTTLSNVVYYITLLYTKTTD